MEKEKLFQMKLFLVPKTQHHMLKCMNLYSCSNFLLIMTVECSVDVCYFKSVNKSKYSKVKILLVPGLMMIGD